MDVEECVGASKDNEMLRCVVQAMARKPGATLLCLTLGCVLLLPLLGHYIVMLALAALSTLGVLQFRGEQSLSWLMTNGQLVSVGLMFVITAGTILAWYFGMKNIYTKYFRTHQLQALHEQSPLRIHSFHLKSLQKFESFIRDKQQ